MATKTTIEMAREAAGDDWGLFQEYMPEIHRLVELVRADERARMAEQPTTTENNGGKTGWPPGLLQDDCKGLSKWLSNRPDAKRRVREALAEQPAQQQEPEPDRVKFERHWRKTRGDKKANRELPRHQLQPQTYIQDSANRHWVTWQAAVRSVAPPASKPLTSQERDAQRWRFLMDNSYDSQSVTQFHIWEHSWEPHSKTGEPTEWKQRVRGIALIDFIDRAIEAAHNIKENT